MKKQVLIIDNNDSFTFNLVQSFKYIDVVPTVININQVEYFDFNDYFNIVLSPGPGLPDENPNLIKFILNYKENKKILGVCLGLQAIALAFGGSLINLYTPRHGYSSKLILKQHSKLYKNLDKIEVGLYHSWAANPENLPEELIIDAIDNENVIMSLFHSKFDITGVQYHPESIITKNGLEILTNWLNS